MAETWPRAWWANVALYSAVFTLLCVASQVMSGGYQSDRGQAGDEAAHFVSALMIYDYLIGHLGENPIDFAKDYYAHFPRVAIGHWPPFFELVQALPFLFGRNGTTAIALQAVLAGLCAGLPAAVVSRRQGPVLGFVAGAIVLFSPYFLFLTNTVMADSLLAVLVFASGLAWDRFYKRNDWKGCLLFAGLASAAILTKGSAFSLALLPPIYLLIKRDLWAMLRPRVLASGILVGIAVVPWYVATYAYATDGFNFSLGWSFTSLAVPSYLLGIAQSVGIPVALAYAFGLLSFAWSKSSDDRADVELNTALSLAMLTFLFAAPAAITPRYLIPILPSIAVVAMCALSRLIDWIGSSRSLSHHYRNAIIALVSVVSVTSVFERPHVEPFNAMDAAALIEKHGDENPLVLVSGSTRFEGSMIATFAERERVPFHYVVRATKVFASGDFMGSNYKQRFGSPQEMKDWMLANQIGYLVFFDDIEAQVLSHNASLRALIGGEDRVFTMIGNIQGERGNIEVYALPSAGTEPSRSNGVFSEIQLLK